MLVPAARRPASVSCIWLASSPGTGTFFESGRFWNSIHGSWAASPARSSLASAAAATVASSPIAITIRAPRGGRLSV